MYVGQEATVRTRHPGMRSQVGLKKRRYERGSRGNRILAKLFQTLKDDAVKVLHSVCQQI